MDVVKAADGHRRFILGPVEAGFMAAVPVALISVLAWIAIGAFNRLDSLTASSAKQDGKMEAIGVQLATMSAALAGVPQMSTNLAELKVRVDGHDQDINELRAMRGLK